MDFPIDQLTQHPVPEWATQALGCKVLEIFEGREDWLAIVENQELIEQLEPNQSLLCRPESRGLIVSAPGESADFVSRCFFPKAGIPEDPVTGSAHTTMAAYWAPKLGAKLRARQLSARGGELGVEVVDERVLLTGSASTFMIGEFFLPN